MRVTRNFDAVYREQDDPWQIGKADSDRYNFYRDKLLHSATKRSSLLDIGCGFGAFLARFQSDFSDLTGVEISPIAIQKGREKHPFIHFLQGSAAALDQMDLRPDYDAIICSDVLYYLPEKGKRALLQWIADHLQKGGLALLAAWAPGGKYLTRDEMKRLVERYFVIEEEHFLPTEHAVFLCRKKWQYLALTIDVETWHPIPAGKTIDWDKDLFHPMDRMIEMGAREGVPFTFMIEMGEYFWASQHLPALARRMEAQWERAIREGHDVQLHLHPNWLPELGAQCIEGRWHWDWSKRKAHDYPGDLTALIGRCKQTLEERLQRIKPDYRVTSFRAGTYQAQPFSRLFDALVQNGIACDSSVFPFAVSAERGYDYSHAYSDHSPYWPSRYDPQLKAPPAERKLIEIPVFVFKPGEKWCLDGTEGARFAQRLLRHLGQQRELSSEIYRLLKRVRSFVGLKEPEREQSLVSHGYFVLIGHTKGEPDFEGIRQNLRFLKADRRLQWVTLSEMAAIGKEELAKVPLSLPQEHPLSDLQGRIPLDRERLLVMGQDDSIAKQYSWMHIETGSPASFPAATFDCVYADNTLQHAFDVDRSLAEIFHVLKEDGVLIAALPSKSRGAAWETVPHEVEMRLKQAGFSPVEIEEVGPMMYIRAWKKNRPFSRRERALEAMDWVYRNLAPEKSNEAIDPCDLLQAGYAFCMGYAIVLGDLLKREGYSLSWLTLFAQDHPRGRGRKGIESHEVLLLQIEGKEMIFDPMANTLIPHSLREILQNPHLAVNKSHPDRRYCERSYHLYDTSFWYSRVFQYAIRSHLQETPRFFRGGSKIRKNQKRSSGTRSPNDC